MKWAPQEIRTFFVTSVTADRRRLFQVEQNSTLLTSILAEYREKRRFLLHAFVVMPDHLHLLLTPAPDIALEKAMQYVKGGFSFRLKNPGAVWQKSFAEHRVKNARDFADHLEYVEQNPVRAKLVEKAEDFAFSSASQRWLCDAAPTHLAGQG